MEDTLNKNNATETIKSKNNTNFENGRRPQVLKNGNTSNKNNATKTI
jgi:hypothetical protein